MSGHDRSSPGDILIVEDNRINSVLTQRLVERAGFVADAAFSGAEAIERLSHHTYRLVLMDLQLPDMTGVETARAIREDGLPVQDRSVPIVALTAYADTEDREACSRVGIDTVVDKPIDDTKLYEVLHRYLGAPSPAASVAPHAPADAPASDTAAAFDPAELETRLGSAQLARTVVSRFLGVIDERRAAVKAALASGEAAGIRAAAHSFAGPAANSGTPALHALLKRMETAAAAGDTEEIRKHAADLDAEVERVRKALEEYLG